MGSPTQIAIPYSAEPGPNSDKGYRYKNCYSNADGQQAEKSSRGFLKRRDKSRRYHLAKVRNAMVHTAGWMSRE
ncbi:hypothetical protein RRG08_003875 [Elysia crispata]|uniref:Uncharacterized protein n=1 Tax=Elysia crispata TaxID=231223 RepID=A0AAE0ZDW2_9GAST|nr:hypothetical protein RRG08_003875 [Elysia crispata]